MGTTLGGSLGSALPPVAVRLLGVGRLSIVAGPVLWVVIAAACAALVASVGWRDGRWRRQLVVAVPVATACALAAAAVVALVEPISFPPSFFLWASLVPLAVAAAAVGWRHAGALAHGTSVAAVLLAVVLLGALVNQHYRYFPTLGALLGAEAERPVRLEDLDRLRADVLASGRRPSEGVTVAVPVPAPASGFGARPAHVYLPPAWFADPAPSLPVLVLLQGTPGETSDWTRAASVDVTADAFAARHDGRAPILVMADPNGSFAGDTECVDSRRSGRAETYLVEDVPAFARDRFGGDISPGSLGIAGLSAGGQCALVLSLRHPDVFRTFADFSGLSAAQLEPPGDTVRDLFDGDARAAADHDALVLLARRRYPELAGWFEVGEQDHAPLAATRRVVDAATAAGMETCALIRPGGHDFGFWEQAFRHALPWLAGRLGVTPPPPPAEVAADCTPPAPG